MTREEKIALLVDELEDIRCDNFDADTDEDKTLKEAVRAIKTLKQQPILDKIRAEIEQMPSELTTDGRRMVRRGSVFRVIEKYKAESEG